MVVHLASEKCSMNLSNSQRPLKDKKPSGGSGGGHTDRAAKIAAIKNKLKSLEGEESSAKRPKTEA
jgi:RNA-binding protein 18